MKLLIFTIVCAAMLWRRFASANDDALWLARSCVGDAGCNAWDTGECAAILHIYKKRAEKTSETVVSMASRYSAAIKRFDGRKNNWVLGLRNEIFDLIDMASPFVLDIERRLRVIKKKWSEL